jgi:hypothetical protein
MARRRFPPPWTVEEYNDACFIVRDHDGQQLAYVYFEEEPGRRSAAKLLTKDEARRIVVNTQQLLAPQPIRHHDSGGPDVYRSNFNIWPRSSFYRRIDAFTRHDLASFDVDDRHVGRVQ